VAVRVVLENEAALVVTEVELAELAERAAPRYRT